MRTRNYIYFFSFNFFVFLLRFYYREWVVNTMFRLRWPNHHWLRTTTQCATSEIVGRHRTVYGCDAQYYKFPCFMRVYSYKKTYAVDVRHTTTHTHTHYTHTRTRSATQLPAAGICVQRTSFGLYDVVGILLSCLLRNCVCLLNTPHCRCIGMFKQKYCKQTVKPSTVSRALCIGFVVRQNEKFHRICWTAFDGLGNLFIYFESTRSHHCIALELIKWEFIKKYQFLRFKWNVSLTSPRGDYISLNIFYSKRWVFYF